MRTGQRACCELALPARLLNSPPLFLAHLNTMSKKQEKNLADEHSVRPPEKWARNDGFHIRILASVVLLRSRSSLPALFPANFLPCRRSQGLATTALPVLGMLRPICGIITAVTVSNSNMSSICLQTCPYLLTRRIDSEQTPFFPYSSPP
jgi:hypothetical protein